MWLALSACNAPEDPVAYPRSVPEAGP